MSAIDSGASSLAMGLEIVTIVSDVMEVIVMGVARVVAVAGVEEIVVTAVETFSNNHTIKIIPTTIMAMITQ